MSTTPLPKERTQVATTPMVSLDTMSSAASYIRQYWGDYGYRIGLESSNGRSAIFVVRCSDGSEFRILVDHWGNAGRYADGCVCGVPEPIIGNEACPAEHYEPMPKSYR